MSNWTKAQWGQIFYDVQFESEASQAKDKDFIQTKSHLTLRERWKLILEKETSDLNSQFFTYSSVPNRRAVWNKRAGGKILKKQ